MTRGMEDQLFGSGDLRRRHIQRIFQNYDVDPHMHPDGTFEANRLERLVNDPTVTFDNIRRAAIMAAKNGFTNREIAQQYPHTNPITMSDPRNMIDTSFSFDGEQEFTERGVRLAENSPFEPDDLGFDLELLRREGDEAEEAEEDVIPTSTESEIPVEEQMLNPDAPPTNDPVVLPEDPQPTGETAVQPTTEEPI